MTIRAGGRTDGSRLGWMDGRTETEGIDDGADVSLSPRGLTTTGPHSMSELNARRNTDPNPFVYESLGYSVEI